MNRKGKMPALEEQHRQVVKETPDMPAGEDLNLEQPYVGRIVQTVTTYSVSDKPEQLQF